VAGNPNTPVSEFVQELAEYKGQEDHINNLIAKLKQENIPTVGSLSKLTVEQLRTAGIPLGDCSILVEGAKKSTAKSKLLSLMWCFKPLVAQMIWSTSSYHSGILFRAQALIVWALLLSGYTVVSHAPEWMLHAGPRPAPRLQPEDLNGSGEEEDEEDEED
jgi:hypothetical protein